MKLLPPSKFGLRGLLLLKIIKTSIKLLRILSISCILSSGATVFLDQRRFGNTLALFSWSDRAELVLWRWPFPVPYPCCLVELYQACVLGERRVEWEKAETRSYFPACLHLHKKERGWQKDYSVHFLTVEGYMCDVSSHWYIHRPVYVLENHSLLPPFFVFLLFCSLASPHSCFFYYFISASVPTSPSVSLLFFPFPSSPFLPPSHFPSLHVPLSIVVICPVANSASVCSSRLCW